MEIDGKVIFYGVVVFMTVEYLWGLYLSLRQHKVYKKTNEIPTQLIGILSKETFDKARVYGLDKNVFSMVSQTLSVALNIAFLSLNGLKLTWDLAGSIVKYFGFSGYEILQSAVCISILNFLSSFVGLFFSFYYTFVLEEKHGFNKQTIGFFFWDKLKMHLVQQAIIVPLISGIIYIVEIGGQYFFIYLYIFVTCVTLFLYTIYPDYIAPLFDKYTPLPEGDLKTQIENLAKSVDFPLKKLYVVEGSKRSAHSNAYFYGLFNNKRIVLFDTLLQDDKFDSSKTTPNKTLKEKSSEKSKDSFEGKEKKGCSTPEVLAVLAHELGHWKLNHVVKNILIGQVNLLVVFLVFGSLIRYKPLYEGFGFTNSEPILMGLLIILHFVFLPYFEILNCCLAMISRHFEFQADRFAKQLHRAHELKQALIKLNSDNLGFPIYDSLYSKWHHSHPPLLERLQALDKEN